MIATAALGLLAPPAGAQQTAAGASGTLVSGVVRDSIARAPLAGAWVQLVTADSLAAAALGGARTAMSDSLGRFSFEHVPEGRYRLGFFHAVLDSLGIEAPLRDITVRRGRAVQTELAVPSGRTLGALICGERIGRDAGVVVTGAAVIGVVRDARGGAPVADAVVSGEWMEISIGGARIDRRRPRVVVTTGANGWFALCNAPVGGTMFLTAGHGADSTDVIEASVPTDGFLRRDLYLGRARLGGGRVTGVVVKAETGQPLTYAQVHFVDGPATRANERGEWTIGNAPPGTRVLEVRAVGYYPERRAVDVIDAAPPIRSALLTFKAVLDTVRIIAKVGPDRQFSGFDERARSGMGRFYTAADLERRGVIETSDLFKMVPGVYVERTATGTLLQMRSAFTADVQTDPSYRCRPSVYLDGMQLWEASADEIDVAAPVRRVRAIEVYTESNVPPQFNRAMNGCGAIVIWSK